MATKRLPALALALCLLTGSALGEAAETVAPEVSTSVVETEVSAPVAVVEEAPAASAPVAEATAQVETLVQAQPSGSEAATALEETGTIADTVTEGEGSATVKATENANASETVMEDTASAAAEAISDAETDSADGSSADGQTTSADGTEESSTEGDSTSDASDEGDHGTDADAPGADSGAEPNDSDSSVDTDSSEEAGKSDHGENGDSADRVEQPAEAVPLAARTLTLSGAEEKNGSYRYPWVATGKLRFDWPATGDSYGFALYWNGEAVWTKVTTRASIEVPCVEIVAGSWTAGVAAYQNGAAVATYKLPFTLYVPDGTVSNVSTDSDALRLNVTVLGAQNAQVSYSKNSAVTFSWTDVGATLYSLQINEGDTQAALLYTESTSAEVSFDSLEPAAYTAVVCASLPDGQVVAGTTAFLVSEAKSGDKDSSSGAKDGASGGKKRSTKNLKNAKQSSGPVGFSVTPGKALTSTHSAGTRDMTLYGTVDLHVDYWQSDKLSMGGEELDVTCGGAYFDASLRQGVLTLRSQTDDWEITQAALKTLNRSGVTDVVVTDGSASLILPTDTDFTGSTYAALRAKGVASSDFIFETMDGAWTVRVDETTYSLDDGVLSPLT